MLGQSIVQEQARKEQDGARSSPPHNSAPTHGPGLTVTALDIKNACKKEGDHAGKVATAKG